jgi:hypothetical protein
LNTSDVLSHFLRLTASQIVGIRAFEKITRLSRHLIEDVKTPMRADAVKGEQATMVSAGSSGESVGGDGGDANWEDEKSDNAAERESAKMVQRLKFSKGGIKRVWEKETK